MKQRIAVVGAGAVVDVERAVGDETYLKTGRAQGSIL